MQRFDEAIDAYKASLAISPKDDSALYNLGIAYKHAGKPELAVEAWKNASSLNRDDPKPLLAMADFYYEKNFYDLAERTYQDLISKWPRVQEAHFKMGTIYYKRDKYEYALKAYKRVIELDDKNDIARRAYINIAVLSTKMKHDEESANESIRMIQKALLIKPDDAESLFSLGLLYFHKEMYDKAVDTFYQALKGARESTLIAQSYNNIGKSYYKKKNYKKALHAFTRAVEEDSSNEEIRLNRKTAMQAYEQELALSR
jgi:tetratricopeptide (TPR) repeat protein